MKISQINFTSILEPELISFCEMSYCSDNEKIKVQRTHNFKLRETLLLFNRKNVDDESLNPIFQIQLVEIPQQEEDSAINAHIHFPGKSKSVSLLMVFKKETDNQMWVNKIVNKIEEIMNKMMAEEAKAKADASEEANLTPSEAPVLFDDSTSVEEIEDSDESPSSDDLPNPDDVLPQE